MEIAIRKFSPQQLLKVGNIDVLIVNRLALHDGNALVLDLDKIPWERAQYRLKGLDSLLQGHESQLSGCLIVVGQTCMGGVTRCKEILDHLSHEPWLQLLDAREPSAR